MFIEFILISLQTKKSMMDCYVVSILLYGNKYCTLKIPWMVRVSKEVLKIGNRKNTQNQLKFIRHVMKKAGLG